MSGIDYSCWKEVSRFPSIPGSLAAYEADDLGRAIAWASPGTLASTRRLIWASSLLSEQLISCGVVCCRQQR